MKQKLIFIPFLAISFLAQAQIDWNNYSTSFMGNGKEGVRPTLVTAIPYNGLYSGASYSSPASDSLHLADSFNTPGDRRPQWIGQANTIDSGDVYFVAPGVHPDNAVRYEFRVVLDGARTLLPWSPINRFTAPGIVLNEFKPFFGFLGGFRTTWGHNLLVDLRDRRTNTIISSSVVYWRSAHPGLSRIYITSDLRSFIAGKGNFFDSKPDSSLQRRMDLLLQNRLVLGTQDNSLIFVVSADVYQRQALEYQLLRKGLVLKPWRPNDFDNPAIYLEDLPPGSYTLQTRLSAQRHNVSSYSFVIEHDSRQAFLIALSIPLVILLLATIILVVILVRQRRRAKAQKAYRERLNLELRAIRSQLNPHFVFNALGSIQGLINRNEIDAANRYLSGFAHLMRESLDAGEKDTIELSREIAILDTYLKLEQLRFGFHYFIEIDPLLPRETEIPAFLLQPLVENAVKHGVSAIQEQGRISIRLFRENSNFIAEVTDNGKGWDQAAKTTGRGIRLTRERIRLLNQVIKGPSVAMTIDSSTANGTTVRLRFSNWWT
jgi:two-component system LytT family sensor kinase